VSAYAPLPPVPGPAAAPARRPTSVSVAANLLVALGGSGLAYSIASLAFTPSIVDKLRTGATRTSASPADVDDFITATWAVAGVGAIISVLLFAASLALALGLRRGSQRARVTTWVLGGLGLLCGCGTGLASMIMRAGVEGMPAGLSAAISDAYPPGWMWLNVGLTIGQFVGWAVLSALLMFGGSWFRRPDTLNRAWTPEPAQQKPGPYQPSGYGTFPSLPPVPGQSGLGQSGLGRSGLGQSGVGRPDSGGQFGAGRSGAGTGEPNPWARPATAARDSVAGSPAPNGSPGPSGGSEPAHNPEASSPQPQPQPQTGPQTGPRRQSSAEPEDRWVPPSS
jgi:hypothetical protein